MGATTQQDACAALRQNSAANRGLGSELGTVKRGMSAVAMRHRQVNLCSDKRAQRLVAMFWAQVS
jgi:hypothetical protein